MSAAKKWRLEVKLTKVQATQEQLERLRRLTVKRKGNKDDKKKNDYTDAPRSSFQTVTESPVRHRLSNLLDGSVPSPTRDKQGLLDDAEENVTSINCEGDALSTAETSSTPESTKACLFEAVSPSSDNNDSLPVMQDDDCITVPCYPDVVYGTCLQVKDTLNESLATDSQIADVGASWAQEKENSPANEGAEHHDEEQSSKDDTVLNVPEQQPELGHAAASNSCDVAVSDLPRVAALSESDIDYGSGFNTLEVCRYSLSS